MSFDPICDLVCCCGSLKALRAEGCGLNSVSFSNPILARVRDGGWCKMWRH